MPSEDGWNPAQAAPDQCEWVTVPGADVTLQLLKGQPAVLLRAWAADWNAYLEPLRDADSAGWTPTNSVPTSNHLNGTAIDLNWDSHPFEQRGSFNAAQMQTMSEMEGFYEGTVFWSGRWDDPVDEMHSQCGYNSFGNPHTQDFINRNIRPDGFSTFRRGTAPPPVLSGADRYALAWIDEGRKRNISRRGICIALTVPFVESGWQMYANSNVPDSLNYPHDAVGSDHDSTGLAQQRQAWGPLSCTMDAACSAGLFYDGGQSGQRGLTDFDYDNAANSPGFYAQSVQVSAFPDRYDQHWDAANALFDRLAGQPAPIPPPPPPPSGDDMAQVPQAQWDALFTAVMTQRPSRSPLRHLGEGTVGDAPDQVWDIDGSVHVLIVKMLAELGSPNDLALLREVAGADPGLYPDRQGDRQLAASILACVTRPTPVTPPPVTYIPPAPVPILPPLPAPLPPQLPLAALTSSGPTADKRTTGQIIGELYEALNDLKLADALPIDARAPLAALIEVLTIKNGSQLK